MAPPQRRERRRTHLDASVVPVEHALLARARELHGEAADAGDVVGLLKDACAQEFTRLAEELHWH